MRMSGRLGGRVVLTLLLALPFGAAANEMDDEDPGPDPVLPEPAVVEQHVPPPAAAPMPAPQPAPAPDVATPHPAAPAAGNTAPPAAGDAPKRLGRPFPTPVAPPTPPEDPSVHVTIIPSGESSVGRNRIRGGGADQGGGDEGAEHPGDD